MRSQYTQSASDIRKQERVNTSPGNATRVFGILLVLMQIAICLIYGFWVELPPLNAISLAFSSIITIILLLFMVVVGFGAIFAYERKLVWSALGFNFLIVCLTTEWFFLIYLFWLKCDIRRFGVKFKSGAWWFNSIWLTNNIGGYSYPHDNTILEIPNIISVGGCLAQAIKCALANCIGFSAILGRAGPLQAFFIALIGTIGFQLNRAVCQNIYIDYGGTYTIFIYGGFMSLIIGFFLRFKQSQNQSTERDPRYTTDYNSGAFSFLGACMLFAVFPILTTDSETSERYKNWYPINFTNGVSTYNVPLSIWFAMSSSLSLGYAFSTLINGKVVARDFINSLVAGGVAACSAGVFFTNPVWAMVLGSTCGIVQAIVQRTIEQSVANNSRIFHTYSFTLFGVQGLIGAIFASIFSAVIIHKDDSIAYNHAYIKHQGYDLLIGVISAGIGLGFGLLSGILVLISTKHERYDYFDDYTYWVPDDGIRYENIRQPIQTPNVTPIPQQPIIPVPIQPQSQIFVKESNANVKAKHAYL